MTTQAKKEKMSEEQMVHLLRNALLVAGQEMGDGDQWPVVKDTVYRLMKDWEDLKVERNADEVVKPHLYEQLRLMEEGLKTCSPEAQASIAPKLKDLRDVYDAYFAAVDPQMMNADDGEEPVHIQRMKAIIATMEDDHE